MSRIGPNKWRVAGFAGRAIFFYAEAGNEKPEFTVNNQLTLGEIGQWRAMDAGRHLIVGHGGRAIVGSAPDGKPGEIRVTFEGVGLAM